MNNWRIMVVDDEEDIRSLIKATLSGEYEVVEAHDGLDALEKLDTFQPDFIVMDVMMPLMNGLDASIAIRDNSKFNHVPILFLSALSTSEDMQKAYRSGADLYLTKPFDPPHLLSTVQNFIKKSPYSPVEKTYTLEQLKSMKAPKEKGVQKETGAPGRAKAKSYQDAVERQPVPSHRPNLYEQSVSQILPRIMVVDDEQDMLDFLRLTLQEGFEVVGASDGIEAIRKVVLYQPDLFVLDIMLPKMSGYQLCQSLRRNRTYQKSPVIMISAKSNPKDKEYAYRMGADRYLTKPFYARDLIDCVNQIIGERNIQIRPKKLSINEIEEQESGGKSGFEEKDERILKRREESEIQKLIRRELMKEQQDRKKKK